MKMCLHLSGLLTTDVAEQFDEETVSVCLDERESTTVSGVCLPTSREIPSPGPDAALAVTCA